LLFITHLTEQEYQIFVVLQYTAEGTGALFVKFLWSLKIRIKPDHTTVPTVSQTLGVNTEITNPFIIF